MYALIVLLMDYGGYAPRCEFHAHDKNMQKWRCGDDTKEGHWAKGHTGRACVVVGSGV